jgi:hypothetical protein
MPTGRTTTDAINDSLDVVVAGARAVSEYEGVMSKLVDNQTLEENTGVSWKETSYRKLADPQQVTEDSEINNPQQIVDDSLVVTPYMVVIETYMSDRVANRMSKKGLAKIGGLAMNSVTRYKDKAGLLVLDGFTTISGGAGTTMNSDYIARAVVRARSNTTEGAMGPIRTVLHGFQAYDIQSEITAPVGTHPVTDGLTARVFADGAISVGKVGGSDLYIDDNLAIDSQDDAKGGTFAEKGIVLVQGTIKTPETMRRPNIGGGGTSVFTRAEFAYAERLAGGTTSAWGYEQYSDASSP